jgi:DNA-binding CsgD family transcriptional regulator
VHEPLSAAQLRVLALLNRGLTTSEMAQELGIAVGTVRWHLNQVFDRLRVRNRTQAVVKARELRLV